MPLSAAVNHREQFAPNPGHHYDIDPNKNFVVVIVGDITLQHAFHRAVQQSSPGCGSLAGPSKMHIVLQTVLEVADDGVVEVVAWRSAVHHNGDDSAANAVLGCNETVDDVRHCCRGWDKWPGPLLLHLGFDGRGCRLDLYRRD